MWVESTWREWLLQQDSGEVGIPRMDVVAEQIRDRHAETPTVDPVVSLPA